MKMSKRGVIVGLYTCMVLLLVGCSFMPPKFDATEYSSIVLLATLAETPRCEIPQVERLREQSRFTKTYAQHIPNNEDTFKSLQEIDAAVDTLLVRVKSEPVSASYCRLKYYGIELMTHVLLDAVGRKPR